MRRGQALPARDAISQIMTAYFTQPWANFFVAAAGASGALVGLVMVALSVNINPILKSFHLPARAAAAIATLVLALVCSMAELIPQKTSMLAAEILVFAMLAWLIQLRSAQQAFAAKLQVRRPLYETLAGIIIGQIQVLPFLIGGILELNETEKSVYWIAAGTIAVFIFSVFNAWVLLIEILR